MLQSLWLLMVFFAFLALGTQAPFILSLGYVWIDAFSPQDVASMFLNQLPIAMIMGVAAIGAYIAMDRRSPPQLNIITVCQVLLALWSTVTLIWAVNPATAFSKWNWVSKTLLFSAFLPFSIRSRIQIEAFAQVYFFALAGNLLPFGMKMAISGGGYGQNLGLVGGNAGLAEGSTLATVAVMTVPLGLFLSKHGQLLPKIFAVKYLYYALVAAALLTTVGTFERTGLIGLLVLAVATFVKSKHKILVLFATTVCGIVIAYITSGAWTSRISTIGTYQADSSAMGRILVWQWTLDYVRSNPLGGSFDSYVINHITFADGEEAFGKAFHSIWFEVLGELGWIGLFLLIALFIGAQLMLRKVARQVRNIPELAWCRDLAAALQVSLVVAAVCGSFIGIAYRPYIHYPLAMSVCLWAYVRRSLTVVPTTQGWRSKAVDPPTTKGRIASRTQQVNRRVR